MIKRKLAAFCLAFCLICVSRSYAQQGKSEISLGYGYLSVYNLYNGSPYNYSSGTPFINYRYYLTGNVTLGLGVGVESISNWGNFTTVAAEVSVAYLDTWQENVRWRLYGSAAYGFSVFTNTNLRTDEADNSGVWAYGFQLTPIGVRVGRQIAAFLEAGFGYKGVVNGGLSVRFPQKPTGHHAAK